MKRFILAALILLAMTTTANAQWGYRYRSGCANGQCGVRYYQPSGCANGQCGVQQYYNSYYYQGGCANGQCGVQTTDNLIPEQKTITSSQETDEYNPTALSVKVLKVKATCVECSTSLIFDYSLGNHNASCPKCGHMYMVKDNQVFSYVKKEAKQVAQSISSLLAEANAVRAQYGLRALSLDIRLESGSNYQASFCSRIGRLQHGQGVAEILAQNYSGFAQALSQWLQSPCHRALLLNPNFSLGGAAMVRDSSGRVWCAMQFR